MSWAIKAFHEICNQHLSTVHSLDVCSQYTLWVKRCDTDKIDENKKYNCTHSFVSTWQLATTTCLANKIGNRQANIVTRIIWLQNLCAIYALLLKCVGTSRFIDKQKPYAAYCSYCSPEQRPLFNWEVTLCFFNVPLFKQPYVNTLLFGPNVCHFSLNLGRIEI